MVKTIQISTPIQFFGPNYITGLCTFTGTEENRAALYDNSADELATISNADTSQATVWSVTFADKYGQAVARAVDTVIIENCSADSVEILYTNEADELVSLGKFALEKNNIFTVAECLAKGLVFRFFCKEESFVVGEIRALKYLFDLEATSQTQIDPNTDGGSYTTQDSGFHTWTNYYKLGLSIEVNNGNYEQYMVLSDRVKESKNVTIVPFYELAFFVVEGAINREIKPSVNRFSGLLDYSIKVVSV